MQSKIKAFSVESKEQRDRLIGEMFEREDAQAVIEREGMYLQGVDLLPVVKYLSTRLREARTGQVDHP